MASRRARIRVPQALLAGAVAAMLAAGCGDDDPAASTSAATTESTTVADDAVSGGGQATTSKPDGEQPNGGKGDGGSNADDSAATGQQPTQEQVKEGLQRQEELNEKIREAALEARESHDPEALERLRDEMKPTPEQRRAIKDWIRERCAQPDPPRFCERLP